MGISLDPSRNASSVRKHGVSLSEADGVLIVLVWVGSPGDIRAISVRRAEPGGRRAYEEGS
jgi:uncharacterized DUF497 family protein